MSVLTPLADPARRSRLAVFGNFRSPLDQLPLTRFFRPLYSHRQSSVSISWCHGTVGGFRIKVNLYASVATAWRLLGFVREAVAKLTYKLTSLSVAYIISRHRYNKINTLPWLLIYARQAVAKLGINSRIG